MDNCTNIINDFIKSSNEKLSVIFHHSGKYDLDNGTIYYKNLECKMNKNNYDLLKNKSSKFKSTCFYDEIIDENGSIVTIPSKIILNSSS